jgi:hypothetical protein
MILSNCLVSPGGRLKVQRKCRGKEARAELINCNLAPWERKLELADNFLSTLQTRGDSSVMLGLVVPKGSPR